MDRRWAPSRGDRAVTTRAGKVGRRVPFAALAVAAGIAAVTSIAHAASLSVGSARITTSSSAVTVPPSTCSIVAVDDAALDRATQTTNYGNVGFLSIRAQSNNSQRRSLVKFNIASCNIPSSAAVRSATLTLAVTTAPGASRNYTAHRVTAAWSEATVTYSNQPNFSAAATSTVASGATPTSISWPVLSDVSAFVRGTAANNGWLLKDVSETTNPSTETLFASSEAAAAGSRPTLEVIYYP